MTLPRDPLNEWLETDGTGGFAMGTIGGCRTRRYHGLLVAAAHQHAGRMMLVNGMDVEAECEGVTIPLSSQVYLPYVVSPDNRSAFDGFEPDPWPTWTFVLPDGRRLRQEIVQLRGWPCTVVRWMLLQSGPEVTLRVRPFLTGRDYHALHHANPSFRWNPEVTEHGWTFRPYDGVPPVMMQANARFQPEPCWYYDFLYPAERDRGLDDHEDCAMPGVFTWTWRASVAVRSGDAKSSGESQAAGEDVATLIDGSSSALWVLSTETASGGATAAEIPLERVSGWIEEERARRTAVPKRQAGVAHYLVRGHRGPTIIAGYPWFTDWGRDTFISLRGLCLATGQWATAAEILTSWSRFVDQGMLPNRFPDGVSAPEYHAVDASLWFCIAAQELLTQLEELPVRQRAATAIALRDAIRAIIEGYAKGTRFGIRRDNDGLLMAGEHGWQLTWMDAKVDQWVVTPRIGKPVEIQALWLNVLAASADLHPKALRWYEQGLATFRERFWNSPGAGLYDVVDADHQSGAVDPAIRPNQIFAVGGLPLCLLEPEPAAQVVAVVEQHLHTPLGLRTLSPQSQGYHGRYSGDVRQRDGAYHQGTAWPWLLGPFIEAWVRVHGDNPLQRQQARVRWLTPLEQYLQTNGMGHLPEVTDGDPPFAPGGCPFQAWSLGEFLRMDRWLSIGGRTLK
jgi:glycogen debranching enzyme